MKDINCKSVGKRIERIRLSLGYSMNQFASILEVATSTLSYWEAGERLPNPRTLTNIAFYGQISVDELLKGDVIAIRTEDLFMAGNDIREYLHIDVPDDLKESIADNWDIPMGAIESVLGEARIYVVMNTMPTHIKGGRFEPDKDE